MRDSTAGSRHRNPDAREVRIAVAGRWPEVLAALGIDREHLRNRHGPCPVCGGKDRFRFDDKEGRGTWICSQCGAGDGFMLLQRVHGWGFAESLREVTKAARIDSEHSRSPAPRGTISDRECMKGAPATPTPRTRALMRSVASLADVGDTVTYLESRHLWPLPAGCSLRAHAGAPYYDGPELVGKFPALVAAVADIEGEMVTCHVTYLQHGRKLQGYAPRKILGPMAGRRGCAVRLMPLAGDTLGIAEGLETALAAAQIHGVPTWAALNAGMLTKFVPPPGIHRVMIFADADRAGLEAAWHLREELDGRATCELRTPPLPHKDWNDVLLARGKS